jgi:microcystin-dependent protein
MSQPYLGEIRMVGFNFAPTGWALCNGAILSIAQNTALFALLGTTYGGDGQTTFALPDLRGRIPIHQGQGSGLTNRTIGESGGQETVALTLQQMPGHTHALLASPSPGTTTSPIGNTWASSPSLAAYADPAATNTAMSAQSLDLAGGGQSHENMAPFVAVNFVIALAGIFPSQN